VFLNIFGIGAIIIETAISYLINQVTLPEHLSSPPVFSGVRVTRSLVLCVMFCRSLFVLFVLFLLAIVLSVLFLLAIILSVLFRFTDSDYLPLVSSNSSYVIHYCMKCIEIQLTII